MGLARNIGKHRELRRGKGDTIEDGGELLARRLHELRVEAAGSRKRNRTLDTKFLGDRSGRGNRVLRTGENLLRGGIYVGDRATSLFTERIQLFWRRADDGNHARRRRLACLLHEAATRLENLERRVEVEDSGGTQGAPLAKREPSRARKLRRSALLEREIRRVARHEDSRLADVGLRQLLGRAFEADFLKVKTEDGVRLVEQGHRLGVCLGKILAHPRNLGALARKHATVLHSSDIIPKFIRRCGLAKYRGYGADSCRGTSRCLARTRCRTPTSRGRATGDCQISQRP